MSMSAAKRVFLVISLLFSTNGFCYIGQPSITPANPSSQDEVFVNLDFGGCDAFVMPEPLSLVRNGNTVEVVYSTITSSNCNFLPTMFQSSIGMFSAGTYTIVVKRSNVTLGQPPVVSTLGTYTILVQQGAVSTPVPSLSPLSRVILAGFFILMVIFSRKRGFASLLIVCSIGIYAGPSAANSDALP